MHLLNDLFLSKTLVLEIRNEMVRENETVRKKNGEKRKLWEKNGKRKKPWEEEMV